MLDPDLPAGRVGGELQALSTNSLVTVSLPGVPVGRHALCLTSGFLFKPQLSLVSPSCGFLKHGSGRISPLDSSLPPPGVTFEAAVCLTPFSVSVPHLDTQRALQPAPLTLPHGHTSVLSQHPLPACPKHPCPAQASQRGKCPSGSRSALLPGRGGFLG